MWYDIVGEPYEEERDGGGTDGYERTRDIAPYEVGGLELSEPEEGGVVKLVLLLTRLAGFVDVTGENGNGDSEDDGE
jgi:hypothetical protein